MTSPSTRPGWASRLIPPLAIAAAVLVTPATASAHHHGDHHHRHDARGVRAELARGTLLVEGSRHADAVALRLAAGDPTRIQVDAGDNGSPDFSFARSDVNAIAVRMGRGDDIARIDDTNGAFTDAISTTLSGGRGNDSLTGGLGAQSFPGGSRDDTGLRGQGKGTAHPRPGEGAVGGD